ncbi:hypothetical protein F2Q69_00000333 [Brassica cretica]|uniref:Uncharacterized protein n=1 Tax=Brassica cretica TaxID=69181 RepID=A0A8S9P771_BRACR|nr:hypothetical protein F2Q69_00000333 [Brassica cretica]
MCDDDDGNRTNAARHVSLRSTWSRLEINDQPKLSLSRRLFAASPELTYHCG